MNESWEIPVPPEARSPICYVKDGVLAIDALRRIHNPLSRIYNVGSISPSAQEILDEVKKSVPGAPLIFKPNSSSGHIAYGLTVAMASHRLPSLVLIVLVILFAADSFEAPAN